MKTLADILSWLLNTHPWIKTFQIHEWKETMVIYDNSKCKLDGKIIPAGEIVMGCKGVGIVHHECFEQLCDFAIIRDNQEIAFRQAVFNVNGRRK